MSTAVAVAPSEGTQSDDARGKVELAIARRAFRQMWISATVVAVVFGGTVASSALAYVSTFTTEASRQQLAAATSGDAGIAVLLGPVSSIDTVGGYTVYKCFVFLTTIGAIWALLAATRLLRGEEDAGRWQVVLAGGTRASRATAATLLAVGGAVVIVFTGTTLLTLLAGRDPKVGFGGRETVLYGLSLTIAPAVFAAVGAVTSQLGRTRRMATGLGMGVFGVMFVLRMIGDSGPDERWLLWLTPFGWTERMEPFTHNDAWPLVPATLTVGVLAAAAMALSSRRDAGAGVVASRDGSAPRAFGTRTPLGLAFRLDLPVLVAWCVGSAAGAFVLGIIAKLTKASIPESFSDTLDKFGVQGSFVNQYLGVAFLLVATLVALLPAGPIGAMSDEETSGRLIHVLSRPTKRTSWFAGRLALAAAGVVTAGALAGVAAWIGAVSQGVDVALPTMLGAGLNVIPTALLSLAVGALVVAVAPRAAARAVYAVVIWSLLVDLLGSMISSISWLDHLSLFHYMALAPADDPDPRTLALTTGLALVLCTVATVLFDRRDLRTA